MALTVCAIYDDTQTVPSAAGETTGHATH